MKPFSWSLVSSFALLAAGSPIAAPGIRINGRAPASISSSTLSTLKLYAQYAGASYCNSDNAVGSVVTCSGGACPDVTTAGAKITATFAGSTTDIRGFVSTDSVNQVIVVSIRGSHSLRNWIADLEFFQESCSLVSGCLVHSGFANAWDEISSAALTAVKAAKAANPSYRIVFTGHSLGAAVSSLGAAYARASGLVVDIINYGSPRVGNDAFASYVTSQSGDEWRVTHLDDPVPRLPPILLNYAHTSPEYWLSDGTATTTDYATSDVEVCPGTENTDCNAMTLGLDIIAHLYYLGPIGGCSPIEIAFRKRDTVAAAVVEERDEDNFVWWQATSPVTNVTDAQLEQQLNDWVAQDRARTSK
ncbi:extracellular lipase [Nemania sp. FL0916]|nr:extracellular lipase [Nemania sp. FL0916]